MLTHICVIHIVGVWTCRPSGCWKRCESNTSTQRSVNIHLYERYDDNYNSASVDMSLCEHQTNILTIHSRVESKFTQIKCSTLVHCKPTQKNIFFLCSKYLNREHVRTVHVVTFKTTTTTTPIFMTITLYKFILEHINYSKGWEHI